MTELKQPQQAREMMWMMVDGGFHIYGSLFFEKK
jgi:hypothetical protein